MKELNAALNKKLSILMSIRTRMLAVFLICLNSIIVSGGNHTASASGTIKLPFRYVQSFIIIEVQLEKVLPVKLIFDTGAEHSILFERKWTDVIANSYIREIKVIGSDLQQELPAILTSPLNLFFANRYEFSSPLIVLKENTANISQVIGESVQGILSATLFSQYLIEIDYKKRLLILHPKDFEVSKSYKKVDIHFYKNKPYLKTNIISQDTQELNLLLDTGASLALLLYSDSNSLVNMPERIIPGFLGSGLGGMLTGFVGKTHAVQLDTFLMPGVITHFLKLNTTIARNESLIKNGLIGNQILDKFNLIIDFQNESLYLKPAKTFKDVIEYDKSGMLVINGGTDLNKFFIAHVIEGTPAYDAGLRENDEIVKFNGWAVTFFSLSRMNSILQSKEGRKIKISIRRSGKKMKFSFILKSLI